MTCPHWSLVERHAGVPPATPAAARHRPARRLRCPLGVPGRDPVAVGAGGGAQLKLGVEAGRARARRHQREQLRAELARAPPSALPSGAAGPSSAGPVARNYSQVGRGTPARSARRCSWAASDSAGWPNGTPSSTEPGPPDLARALRRLDRVPVLLDLVRAGHADVAEHVRVPADQLVGDPLGDVVDRVAGAVGPLGRDLGVEVPPAAARRRVPRARHRGRRCPARRAPRRSPRAGAAPGTRASAWRPTGTPAGAAP